MKNRKRTIQLKERKKKIKQMKKIDVPNAKKEGRILYQEGERCRISRWWSSMDLKGEQNEEKWKWMNQKENRMKK